MDRRAKGANGLLVLVAAHKPYELTAENVAQLMQGGEQSDVVWLQRQMEEHGYWVLLQEDNAGDFGSFPNRRRLWWDCILNLKGDRDTITRFFLDVYKACKIPFRRNNVLKIFIMDYHERKLEANRCGLKLLAELGVREPKRATTDPEYKVEHYAMFSAHTEIKWPFEVEDFVECNGVHICFGGMLPREREACVFLSHVFSMDLNMQLLVIEFLDGNPTLSRLCSACFDDNGDLKKSPWRRTPPTLVGSMKLFLRYPMIRDDGSEIIQVRCAEGFEYMNCIGWSSSMYGAAVGKGKGEVEGGLEAHEMLANLAGNAWSCYQYAPHLIATIATAGRFRDAAPEGHAQATPEPASLEILDSSAEATSDDGNL